MFRGVDMKRFLSVSIVLCLLISVGFAETDLQSMNLDELADLRNQIDQEIRSRLSNNSGTINTGEYVVGKDIKAGLYELTVTT